jgi:hypothetical protein
MSYISRGGIKKTAKHSRRQFTSIHHWSYVSRHPKKNVTWRRRLGDLLSLGQFAIEFRDHLATWVTQTISRPNHQVGSQCRKALGKKQNESFPNLTNSGIFANKAWPKTGEKWRCKLVWIIPSWSIWNAIQKWHYCVNDHLLGKGVCTKTWKLST